jgi:hypothetical protein
LAFQLAAPPVLYLAGMKGGLGSVRYSIRGVPPEVDRKLRQEASLRKWSLNQIVLEKLANATGERIMRAEFSDLVGAWTPDPEFDQIVAAQRKVNWGKWK